VKARICIRSDWELRNNEEVFKLKEKLGVGEAEPLRLWSCGHHIIV
jgi:hypothetical protein